MRFVFRKENVDSAAPVALPMSALEFKDAFKQKLELELDLGHRATIRDTPTDEGFTHDWMMYVRPYDVARFQLYVEKVIFVLHESFPDPERSRHWF